MGRHARLSMASNIRYPQVMDSTSDATPRTRINPEKALWAIAILGPGTFLLACAVFFTFPGLNEPPNLDAACILFVTHLIAVGLTFGILVTPGPHRRRIEFWFLLLHWFAIAGCFTSALTSSSSTRKVTIGCAVGTAALVLIAVGIRRFLESRASETATQQAPN